MPDAKERLIQLVREHTPGDYALDGGASTQTLFRAYAEHVGHNFRQDIVEDILNRPGDYAAAIDNRERSEA